MFADILLFLVVISFLVIIHELGHFLVAKWCRVHVEEFGLGYPPRALKLFRWRKTLFSLNWIPFGGFVKMEGEDPSEEPTDAAAEGVKKTPTKEMQNTSGDGPFYAKSRQARLAIILAGAAVNFVFGVAAFSTYFSVKGIPDLVSRARIGELAPDSPAARAQLPLNTDLIALRAADKTTPITSAEDAIAAVNAHLGETVTLVTTGTCQQQSTQCEEKMQEFTVTLRKQADIPTGQGSLGIRFAPVIVARFYPWYEMPFRGSWYGIQQALGLSMLILTTLGDIGRTLVQGHVPTAVAGPVGIFTEARRAGLFAQGPWELWNFTGMLSVNLAIMNILPIPALDGGRALFIVFEIVVGRRRLRRVEGYVNYAAFALLLALTALITIKDIRQIWPK